MRASPASTVSSRACRSYRSPDPCPQARARIGGRREQIGALQRLVDGKLPVATLIVGAAILTSTCSIGFFVQA